MGTLLELLQKCDITTILVILGSFYLYDKRMVKRFEKIEDKFDKIDQRFDKVDQRFDKIEETIKDIDRRLCRLEGAFSQKDCCMLKENHHHKAN